MNSLAVAGVKSVAELAETEGIREALQFFAREKRWIDEQHLEVCRVPAPTFLEQKRAEWMVAQLRALGCDAKIDRAGNVVAPLTGPKDGPFVALTAHLDTVLAPRVPEDIRVEPDGRFCGPGVSDNGAGLAALLAIARLVKTHSCLEGLDAGLLLVANVGEEGEGNLSGMRFLCRQSALAPKIKSFVVLDGPTTDHITSEALASRRFELIFTGPGGHSWSDYGVGNPVHALSRAIALFAENGASFSSSPRSSFNFGIIEGGSSINSIPTLARAKVDIRSERAERIDELTLLLTSAVGRALEVENERSTGGRVTGRIREIGSRPGGRLAEDAPILTFIRAVDNYLGIRSHLDCASTDANIPLSMGLPAISIGAGGSGGGAHTPGEWFHPEGRELGLRRVFLTLCLLLRSFSKSGG
jgi:Acetylornithine deacetylase/Succinyl-diaminopimelate desuccinylase and related deacylases